MDGILSVGDFAISPGLQFEGEASTLSAGIPWLVQSDLQLVALVIPASGTSPAEKRLMSHCLKWCAGLLKHVASLSAPWRTMTCFRWRRTRVGFLPKNQVACILPECVLTWLNHLSVFNPCANTQEVGGAEVPMQFRFVIKPRTKVNCFTPKQMDDGDLTNVRYSQLTTLRAGTAITLK